MKRIRLDEAPGLKPQIDALGEASWPAFLLKGGNVHGWPSLFSTFAPFQILLCENGAAGPEVVAVGHTVPIAWDGRFEDLPQTITGIIDRACASLAGVRPATDLCALAAMVCPDRRGRGLSTAIVRAMISLAAERGLGSLLAPVRPPGKADEPETPMDEYVRRMRPDGLPGDPWIRVHRRLGAEVLVIAPATITVTGSVRQWEDWTGLRFAGSGRYPVPGALQPVVIDREGDLGRYDDPNLWMRHRVPQGGDLR